MELRSTLGCGAQIAKIYQRTIDSVIEQHAQLTVADLGEFITS